METVFKDKKEAPDLSAYEMKKGQLPGETVVLICHNLLKKSDYMDLSQMEEELSSEMNHKVMVRIYPHLCQNLSGLEGVLKIRKSSTLILAPCFCEGARKQMEKMSVPKFSFDLKLLGIVNLKPAWKKKREGLSLTHSVLQILRRILRRMDETSIPRTC